MDSLEDEALLRVEEERLGLGDAKGLGGGGRLMVMGHSDGRGGWWWRLG